MNVEKGIQPPFIPAYVIEFEIAAKLGVPAKDLPEQPLGLIHAARTVLEAEAIAHQNAMAKHNRGSR